MTPRLKRINSLSVHKVKRVRDSEFSFKEEIANSIVHGLGLVLAIVGVVVLLVYASVNGDALHIVSVSIFGASLLLLYGSSTLYHSIPNARVKRVLEMCDLIAIYLLIAGSYTTLCQACGGSFRQRLDTRYAWVDLRRAR